MLELWKNSLLPPPAQGGGGAPLQVGGTRGGGDAPWDHRGKQSGPGRAPHWQASGRRGRPGRRARTHGRVAAPRGSARRDGDRPRLAHSRNVTRKGAAGHYLTIAPPSWGRPRRDERALSGEPWVTGGVVLVAVRNCGRTHWGDRSRRSRPSWPPTCCPRSRPSAVSVAGSRRSRPVVGFRPGSRTIGFIVERGGVGPRPRAPDGWIGSGGSTHPHLGGPVALPTLHVLVAELEHEGPVRLVHAAVLAILPGAVPRVGVELDQLVLHTLVHVNLRPGGGDLKPSFRPNQGPPWRDVSRSDRTR